MRISTRAQGRQQVHREIEQGVWRLRDGWKQAGYAVVTHQGTGTVLGVAVDRHNAVMLPLGGVLGMPVDSVRLEERVHGVGHPSRPVLVFGDQVTPDAKFVALRARIRGRRSTRLSSPPTRSRR